MNYWIQSARESLLQTIGCVDVIVLNDAEIRMLTGEPNLTRAARQLRELGPKIIVVKQGSYGACVFGDDGTIPHVIGGFPAGRLRWTWSVMVFENLLSESRAV